MREFNFEITGVDEAAGTMEVTYKTAGHKPVVVGVRLPLQGEDEDDLIEAYAPHTTWDWAEYMAAPKKLPRVGRKGKSKDPVVAERAAEEVVEVQPEIVVRRVKLS